MNKQKPKKQISDFIDIEKKICPGKNKKNQQRQFSGAVQKVNSS